MEKMKNTLAKRDFLLPRYRKSLQEVIEEHLLKDEKVLAVFYGGSIGSNSEDLFSDIDLRIVVDEKDLDEFIAAKRNLAERYGRVLFF
ncbi:hypothetical protein QWY14_03375 [Planococcus sp. N028]|uniref:Polymerase beta nucleotidyltransferase domain-containing protein n=2 Tax=Planococcus shixiaomingii TaxID=3058393 RepID=A0ABT8MYT4_9BACL|nr:hypothetical protein [Planococcus sp. N028]MDN7240812.1 hypothetical protein [Planococcus sp. N028]